MKILYFGSSTFAQPPLAALLNAGFQVAAVVTQPDRPTGRGGKLSAPPLKDFALACELPVLQPESCRTEIFLAEVRKLKVDLSVVAAYGQFLPDNLLSLPPLGSVNLHGSLLPRYRGAAPIQRAIWNGDEESGVCLMRMVKEMDAGGIIACVSEPILAEDNAGTLSARLAQLAAELLLKWLPALIAGNAPQQTQDPSAVTFAPAITKAERIIDWQQPAVTIWRQIRALAPLPTATTTFRKMPVKIFSTILSTKKEDKKGVGEIIVEDNAKAGLCVSTGAGILEITSIQPAGKRPMSGADFLRGYHVTRGERFESINPDQHLGGEG